MARKPLVFLIVAAILAACGSQATPEPTNTTAAEKIPADFAGLTPGSGEIWIWDRGSSHPALTRCTLGRAEGIWYSPKGSPTGSGRASCDGVFDPVKYGVAIGGIPVTCTPGLNPGKMKIDCEK